MKATILSIITVVIITISVLVTGEVARPTPTMTITESMEHCNKSAWATIEKNNMSGSAYPHLFEMCQNANLK